MSWDCPWYVHDHEGCDSGVSCCELRVLPQLSVNSMKRRNGNNRKTPCRQQGTDDSVNPRLE